MRQYAILILCGFILMSCAKIETASNENAQTNSNKIVSISPTIEANTSLKPVTPKIKLNAEQRKYLNESLPPQVREILEKAEKFEVLAEVNLKDEEDGLNFEPNRIAEIANESDKKELLEAFYYDASDGRYPAACYIPHHGFRATHHGKTVEIEICSQCSKFYVKSPFGEFEGGIVRENPKSEAVFNRIIQNQSVEIK